MVPASNQPLLRASIKLPQNPIWRIFKTFGRDEVLALIISVTATFFFDIFGFWTFLLPFVGPVVEKVGFFPWHFYEAQKTYKTTPLKYRKSFLSYFVIAFKNGFKSFAEDVLVHDPLYILFFFVFGALTSMPSWSISALSFVVAVLLVALGEFVVTEIRFVLLKKEMRKKKFEIETYFEARFILPGNFPRENVIEELQKFFGLQCQGNLLYNDIYFDTNHSDYSGRVAKLRLRERDLSNADHPWLKNFGHLRENHSMQTVQLVYTRASEKQESRVLEQFRFFAIAKEKIYAPLNQEMPQDIAQIENKTIRDSLKAGKFLKRISFYRTVLRREDLDLLITIDSENNERGQYMIEIKTRKNLNLLLRAMRFSMGSFPFVAQTTIDKCTSDFALVD